MLKIKSKLRADRGERALKTVAAIGTSIAALQAEDLLDRHDIFLESPGRVIGQMASDEIQHRGLSAS